MLTAMYSWLISEIAFARELGFAWTEILILFACCVMQLGTDDCILRKIKYI